MRALHPLLIDVDTIYGDSPAATPISQHDINTPAIAAISADITVGLNVKLTCRGNLTLSNCRIIQQPGSIFEFDASNATDPLSQNYYAAISIDWGNLNTWWEVPGLDNNRCAILSNAGGGSAYFSSYSIPVGTYALRGGMFRNSSYVDVTRIGDSATPMIYHYFQNASGVDFEITNAVFTACGNISGAASLKELNNFIVDDSTFTNSVSTHNIILTAGNLRDATAQRSMTNCVFDADITMHTAAGFSFSNSLFMERMAGTNNAPADLVADCLFRSTTQPALTTYGSLTNCYLLKDGDIDNPHWHTPASTYDTAFNGNIFDQIGANTTDAGDCILGSGGDVIVTIRQNLFLRPDACPLSLLGDPAAAQSYIYEHNTAQYQVNLNETVASVAGMISSFKSNIVWGVIPNSHYMLHDVGGGAGNDIVNGADLDYNCDYNLIPGSEGWGINIPITAAHSANSITVNPAFVESSRNIETWDASLGGVGTVASALAELSRRNTPAYNPDYNIAALVSYVKSGLAPTEVTLENAGHDGLTIGAIPFADVAVVTFISGSRIISGNNRAGVIKPISSVLGDRVEFSNAQSGQISVSVGVIGNRVSQKAVKEGVITGFVSSIVSGGKVALGVARLGQLIVIANINVNRVADGAGRIGQVIAGLVGSVISGNKTSQGNSAVGEISAVVGVYGNRVNKNSIKIGELFSVVNIDGNRFVEDSNRSGELVFGFLESLVFGNRDVFSNNRFGQIITIIKISGERIEQTDDKSGIIIGQSFTVPNYRIVKVPLYERNVLIRG